MDNFRHNSGPLWVISDMEIIPAKLKKKIRRKNMLLQYLLRVIVAPSDIHDTIPKLSKMKGTVQRK